MEYYQKLLHDILTKYAVHIENFVNGEKSPYLYHCKHDEYYGDTDENYFTRLKLCYALLYDVYPLETEQKKQIVREILETEIISRENESFQGIGSNLEILTYLANILDIPDKTALFQRAKDANFDCYCGYDETGKIYHHQSISEMSLTDCIYTMIDLDELETLPQKDRTFLADCAEKMGNSELAEKIRQTDNKKFSESNG